MVGHKGTFNSYPSLYASGDGGCGILHGLPRDKNDKGWVLDMS